MARKARLHAPGGFYHVMMHGNNGQDIPPTDEDRHRLYFLLQEGVERFGHRIHALCLMTNHLHLPVQLGEVPLAKIIQNVAFRYTRWINTRYASVALQTRPPTRAVAMPRALSTAITDHTLS